MRPSRSFTAARTRTKPRGGKRGQASQRFEPTGQITLIVQDRHPLHMNQKIREGWEGWQQQGLFLLQLPKYSSQMNLIETEWHQFKTDELAGRIFEEEDDLALAVRESVENRAQRGQHTTELFLFNFA
jgi:transposase